MYDFDRGADRRGTASIKWECAPDRLPMGLADMDFMTAPPVQEALRERVAHGVFGYTDVTESTLDAIVGWHARRHGWMIDPAWVTVSPGVITSLALLLRGALEPGAGVIVHTPAFAPITNVISANGFVIVENRLRIEEGRYEIAFADFAASARRPEVSAFVLCSPHNPGGRVWSADELAELAGICADNDVIVVSDEIHAAITHPWADFVSFGAVAPDLPHAVLCGPSKAFNLPGLRTSLSVVADPALRAGLDAERHRINIDFGVDTLGVVALEAAYRHGDPWLDALLEHLAGNVEAFEAALSGSPVRMMRPDGTFLAWLDCRAIGLDDAALDDAFRSAGLELEPGVEFGARGSGFMRINLATTRDRVLEAARRIRSVAG